MMRVAMTQAQKDYLEDQRYKGEILIAMRANGYTQDTLARALGISRTTLRSRLMRPEEIARGEDRRIRRLLGMGGIA